MTREIPIKQFDRRWLAPVEVSVLLLALLSLTYVYVRNGSTLPVGIGSFSFGLYHGVLLLYVLTGGVLTRRCLQWRPTKRPLALAAVLLPAGVAIPVVYQFVSIGLLWFGVLASAIVLAVMQDSSSHRPYVALCVAWVGVATVLTAFVAPGSIGVTTSPGPVRVFIQHAQSAAVLGFELQYLWFSGQGFVLWVSPGTALVGSIAAVAGDRVLLEIPN